MYEVGRRDGSFRTLSPVSRNDIYRTGFSFDLYSAGIISGSTIHSVEHVSTIGGSTYNARTKALSSTQSMSNPTNLWDAIGNSQTTHFSNIPYGSNQRVDSSAAFRQSVQAAVNGDGLFKLGVMSQFENQNQTDASAEVFLRITYTPPPGVITVRNSFGGGLLKVDSNPNISSGHQFTWTAGSQHSLEALDQEWPQSSGQQRTFDNSAGKGWHKRVGSNPPEVITTSRSFTYTVTAGETATLEAQFKTSLAVSGTFTVANGTTYTIPAGTVVSFEPNSKIMVYGTLTANGTSGERIIFTRSGASGDWLGIEFSGSGANNSSISYADIKYAKSPIVATGSNVSVSNVSIGYSSFQNYPHDAAMAFYGSSPTISGVTIWGQANSVNGVRFSQGSYGSLSYSTISDLGAGNGIIIEGSSGPTISNNSILGCRYHGILLPYAGGFPTIRDNSIWGNIDQAYHGIRIDNSQAEVKGNIIYEHNAGFWIDNHSYVRTPYSGDGLNQIYGNVYGIHLEDESDLEFGYVDPWSPSYHYGSCNQLYNNSSYNVHMEGYSYMWAHGNYWYPTPPSGIYAGGSGIEYDCFLQYYWDCESFVNCGQEQMMSGSSTTPDDNDRMLHDAQIARMRQDWATSNSLFARVLKGEATNLQGRMALRGMYRNFVDTKDQSLLEPIESIADATSEAGLTATWLLLKANAALGKIDEATGVAERLITTYPNSETEKEALQFLSFLGGYDESRRSLSAFSSDKLLSTYSESLDNGILAAIPRQSVRGHNEEETQLPATLSLESTTYPNPFNPATTINFTIPQDGFVTLRIYDVLGRVVATLINEERLAGPHRVLWDASQVPSGVYFSRLETPFGSVVNRLLLVK